MKQQSPLNQAVDQLIFEIALALKLPKIIKYLSNNTTIAYIDTKLGNLLNPKRKDNHKPWKYTTYTYSTTTQ